MNKKEKRELEKAIKDANGMKIEIIDKNESFDFKCDACGKCCTNSTIDSILLRPLDIYNLSIALDKEPIEIISKHSNAYIGESSGIPLIQLKGELDRSEESLIHFLQTGSPKTVCPFLKNNKCSVHSHKPGSCRMYPLGRLVSKGKEDESKNEFVYFLQKDVNCGKKGELQNVSDWIGGAEEGEYIFNKESEFLLSLNDKIKLKELNEYASESKSKDLKECLTKFYNKFTVYYYVGYDTKEDFKKQFEDNLEALNDEIDCLVEEIKDLAKLGKLKKKVLEKIIA